MAVFVGLTLLAGVSSFPSYQKIQRQRRKTRIRLQNSPLEDWSGKTGDSALRQVQFLASKVAESTAAGEQTSRYIDKAGSKFVRGTGGVVYNNPEFNRGMGSNDGESSSTLNPNMEIKLNSKREDQVWTALANLELDSKFSWAII